MKYLALFICLISLSAKAADWVNVGSDRLGDLAYDQSRIEILDPWYYNTTNKVIRVPILNNYNQPQNYYTKSRPYMSTVDIQLFDCKTGYTRTARVVVSSQKWDSGDKIGDSYFSEEEAPWIKAGPLNGKVFTKLRYLCN